ncbi:MAG: response regulator transcription factor [Oscillospiraceae bacterium]|nr:response regulator transcription factor [Oscillospiraceae bacterium]
MAQLIYVVEDDEDIRELITCTLESFSYEVQAFPQAEDMLAALEKSRPQLILLDIMLPGMDGIAALGLIRKRPDTARLPVIMLTARTSEVDRVRGLDCGADDYIPKPFGILELTARVRTALRHGEAAGAPIPQDLSCGGIRIDCARHEVWQDGSRVELTLKEYQLLELLMGNRNRVVPRDEILNRIWGIDFAGETRTLDMHIKSLRGKLGDNADLPRYIKTVRGVGYTFLEGQGR